MTEAEHGPGSSETNSPIDDSGVRLQIDGDAATVTLDRPERLNAQTPLLWSALRTIGSALPGNIRVVLVRGAGRTFSAGLDRSLLAVAPALLRVAPAGTQPVTPVGGPSLGELAAMSPQAAGEVIAEYQAAFGWLARSDIITIAAVQGYAVGAGFQLALACDLRVVADDAVFVMAEVGLGLVPDLGGTRRLLELVGYSRALDLCVTARPVPAAEAMRLGLVSRLVPAAELESAAGRLVAELLARPREAVIEAKALLSRAAAPEQAEQERAERAAQHRLLRSLAGWAP